jgi:hypothetical protein
MMLGWPILAPNPDLNQVLLKLYYWVYSFRDYSFDATVSTCQNTRKPAMNSLNPLADLAGIMAAHIQ